MHSIPAIAIFDIGKTNKKMLVFDAQYSLLLEKAMQFTDATDEDGHACEDLQALTQWVLQCIHELVNRNDIAVKAINFAAYGASFVHIDHTGQPVAPLYSYLKPFPEDLQQAFYDAYGGALDFSMCTASPVLGNLNAGLQLYRLKKKQPLLFSRIHRSLHLPQYMSYLVTRQCCSDMTSIGCHTALWNFTQNHYHEWIYKEGVASLLSPIVPSNQVLQANCDGKPLFCGVGLHDSSAALIPYLYTCKEPFALLSTGTWCISLSPFNHSALTAAELQQDCLCYIDHGGRSVKASRLFAGHEHAVQVKRLAAHFNVAEDAYTAVVFDAAAARRLTSAVAQRKETQAGNVLPSFAFPIRELNSFEQYNDAYHQLMIDMVQWQVAATRLVSEGCGVQKLFVDGGFGKNAVYMNLLAAAFPEWQVYAASLAQASAIGAALAIHNCWHKQDVPQNLIELKQYTATGYLRKR